MFRRPDQIRPIPPAFIERCLELGLQTWRFDLNGLPVAEPNAPELLAMWMSSRPMRQVITELASDWSGMDQIGPSEPVPGMRVFPFAETHRRRRTGYFVAIGFEPRILESDLLEPSCVGGSLQLSAVRHQLAANADLSPRCADKLGKMLAWTLDDLTKAEKADRTIDGFTEQLGLTYETVSMLCDLGSGMSAMGDPTAFVDAVGEHVTETLQYRWATVVLDAQGPGGRAQFGGHQVSDEELDELIGRVRSREPDAVAGSTAIFGIDDPASPMAPQLVVHPIKGGGREHGIVIAGGKLGEDPQVSTYETKSFQSLTGLLGAFLENVGLYEDQRRMFFGTIRSMSGALDAKDRYTRGHSDRVAYLSAEIARELGMSEGEIEQVHLSGILHDVGKIGVPEAVLCKPGRLTDEEFEAIKRHPQIGYDILKDIPSLEPILPGVLHHHERFDGRGYPHGLAGEDIPFMARLIGVADTFDAMSSNRAYRSKMSRDVVLAEIRKCSGSQFDPAAAEAFLRLDLAEYDRMVENHASQTAPDSKAA
ncbi:MAG: HD-GYP domain-containing protein [Planctomycetota bacterium]